MIEVASSEFILHHIDELQALDASGNWEPWSRENFLTPLPRKFDYSLVAIGANGIAGAIIGSKKGTAAYIHRIIVNTNERNKGIGSRLLDAFMHRAASIDDVRTCRLKVAKKNKARHFYSTRGFRELWTSEESEYLNLLKPLPGATSVLAVHQPNYLPWNGYFSKIMSSDIFVFLDDVQMPIGRSYVSRTRVRLGDGEQWLSVPINKKNGAEIREIQISNQEWFEKHFLVLQDRYRKWPYFQEVIDVLRLALVNKGEYLWEINAAMIEGICRYMGLNAAFELSSSFASLAKSDDRIIEIAKSVGSSEYLSGVGGMNYQTKEKYEEFGIKLTVQTFRSVDGVGGAPTPRAGLTVLESLFAFGPVGARDFLLQGASRVDSKSISDDE